MGSVCFLQNLLHFTSRFLILVI
uniref:Uncharacterized protein n=1 Tax=Rhizophora mucronata TaxID=61149 RepID=A0A2P2KMJ5_RHIMU